MPQKDREIVQNRLFAPHSNETRLILRAIFFPLFHLTSRKRAVKCSVLWETWMNTVHRVRAIQIFFLLSSLLNDNGELRSRFMGGVTLRRPRNFGFIAARGLSPATGNGLRSTLPPSSRDQTTTSQRTMKSAL